MRKQTISNSYTDQTHITIISTSHFISHAEPCELSLISPISIFKPLVFIQLIWLHFAFSINATTQREKEGRGEDIWKEAYFQNEFKMWTDCKWSLKKIDGSKPVLVQSTVVEEHIWNPSKGPEGGGGLQSMALSKVAQGDRPFKKTTRKDIERTGWQGLICAVAQLFLAELQEASKRYSVVYQQRLTDILHRYNVFICHSISKH